MADFECPIATIERLEAVTHNKQAKIGSEIKTIQDRQE
jgi:hypothetical protein